MYLPVHEVFGSETSLRLVLYRSGWKSRISRFQSSEEYSHVISIKAPSWSGLSYAAGNDCCPAYVCHLRRSSGAACSKGGALRRILLLLSPRTCTRPASRSIAAVEQSTGSESARRWRQYYL